MSRYPALDAAMAERDASELAGVAGVELAELRAVLELRYPAVVGQFRAQLAAALGADADELFRLAPELEPALPAGEARFVRDPATLRRIGALQ